MLWLATASNTGCRRPTSESIPPPSPPRPTFNHPGNVEGGTASTPPPPTTAIDPPAAAAEFRDAAQWLPQGEPAPGWRQSGAVIRSRAADLFQIIDGEAPSYEQYGLHNFAKTDYRRAD